MMLNHLTIKEYACIMYIITCLFLACRISLPGLTLLEPMLQTWVMCAKQTRCSRRFPSHCVPNGAPFYYGTTTVPDGRGGYM